METALLSLLAPVAGGRRYFVTAPQGETLPYLILNRVSVQPSYVMSGVDGFVQSRVQIDIYGDKWPDVFAASQQVGTILSGYRGVINGIRFQGIFIESVRDLASGDAGQSADRPVNNLYRISIDIMINHTPE